MSLLRAAGAIVVGKGNTNEFAYGIDGRNPHRGDCANPLDTARMAGGSSSGPAAATAAGLALTGLGTDASGAIADGVRAAAQRLEHAGAHVVPVSLPSLAESAAIQRIVHGAEAAHAHAGWFEAQRERYAPDVRTRLEAGALVSASAYLTAQQARRRLIEDVADRIAGIDVLLAQRTGHRASADRRAGVGQWPLGGPPCRAALMRGSDQPARLSIDLGPDRHR